MGGNQSSYPCPDQLPLSARKDVFNSNHPSLSAIASLIKSGDIHRIIVMTGAGCSVSAGVPDFRTPGTDKFPILILFPCSVGLYSQLGDLGLPCPEAIFHIRYFRSNPSPFYFLAKRLFPGNFSPTDAHFFSVLLDRKGLLLRHYTQNVDNLEVLAGLPDNKTVFAHGSFGDVHCTRCGRQYTIGWFREQIMSHSDVRRCDAPYVPSDKTDTGEEEDFRRDVIETIEGMSKEDGTDDLLSSELEKMSLGHDDEQIPSSDGMTPNSSPVSSLLQNDLDSQVESNQSTGTNQQIRDESRLCNGLIKPDITFFGEQLPRRFGVLSPADFPEADLLIVMGTSLQVFPFASLIEMANPFCPRLLINREPVGVSQNGGADGKFLFFDDSNYRDVFYEGQCDDGVRELCRLLGWEEELDALKSGLMEKTDLWKLLEERQLLEDYN